MEYKIGEVSKILNISKEMIRYYEKQGALKPSRKTNNNYRNYSTMDIFLLMEILRYQSIGFSIKQIKELLSHNFMNQYATYLSEYSQTLQDQIQLNMILQSRIKEMAERAKTSQYNINQYWFKEIPEHQLIFLCHEKDDHYERIMFDEEKQKILYKNRHMAFFESVVLFEKDCNSWWYGINQEYCQALSLHYDHFQTLKQSLCLCTMIDMGEIGEFKRDCLISIQKYVEKHHYQINGTIRGMIVCRGYQNDKFQRIMEIQVPIMLKP